MTDLPVVFRKDVQPEWVDYNQHMGDFAYGIVFSNAGDLFLEIAGLTPEYRDHSHCTIYTLENHTRFLREVHGDSAIHVTAQLLDHDAKRVHLFLRMYDRDGSLVAEQEQLLMHMQRLPGTDPRPAPFPDDMQAKHAAVFEKHRLLPKPDGAGAPMRIRRKAPA